MAGTDEQLRDHWANPGFSLLLLIGADIVRKAIAQLIGHQVRLPGSRIRLFVAPVAFSFGWVAYSFSNLVAAFGDMKLMPPTDCPSLLVNCSNGFVRENHSWILGRLLRDHELRHHVDSRGEEQGGAAESIRIDIFSLGSVAMTPNRDFVWWFGWAVIPVQIIIATVPWIASGHWGILMATVSGVLLAVTTCGMPQWTAEKWPAAKIAGYNVTCLTRGNGHRHIMVFVGSPGSWNLESLATGGSLPRPETRCISLVLAILWTVFFVSVSAMKTQTWYLVVIGGIGMLQNLLAAATPRSPGAANLHMTQFSRAPTIIGRRMFNEDDKDADVALEEAEKTLASLASWTSQPSSTAGDHPMPRWLDSMSPEDGAPAWLESIRPQRVQIDRAAAPSTTCTLSASLATNHWLPFLRPSVVPAHAEDIIFAAGVHGALIELEKWVPTAGLAMLQVFFPQGLAYNDAAIRDNVHKRFWKRAYGTWQIRTMAERRRRSHEQEATAPFGGQQASC